MATPSADPAALVVVDTNVLLAASDADRDDHAASLAFLERDERRLAVTPQIVREYLAVATREVTANGLGLGVEDAEANVAEFLLDMEILVEDAATTRRLRALLAEVDVTGRQVHDANVVAVALTHGATAVVTGDARNFTRFGPLIDIERPQ